MSPQVGYRGTVEERFTSNLSDINENGCVLWNGCTNRGYGVLSWTGNRFGRAHRYAWERVHGPIPDGLELDHLCRVTLCVNPAHLEPVTHRENVLRGSSPMALQARQTHCKRGHPFDDLNTYKHPTGARRCRACHREDSRRARSAPKIATANATASGDTEERALAHHPQQALAVARDQKDTA